MTTLERVLGPAIPLATVPSPWEICSVREVAAHAWSPDHLKVFSVRIADGAEIWVQPSRVESTTTGYDVEATVAMTDQQILIRTNSFSPASPLLHYYI